MGVDGLEDGPVPFMNVPWQAAHIVDTWRGENSIRICVRRSGAHITPIYNPNPHLVLQVLVGCHGSCWA